MKINKIFENSVNICFASSNEYSPFVSVTIASICKNSDININYDIVVLITDMSDNNKRLITKIGKSMINVSIRCINITDIVKDMDFYTWGPFVDFTYYRLLIPNCFSEYHKVIYLDSDIIVNSDISELFNIDLEDKLFGAAFDTHVVGRLHSKDHPEKDHYINNIHVTDGYSYFQAGVLIYNLDNIKQIFTDDYFINKAMGSEYKWLDQDLLNVEARGMFMQIPCKWNVMVFNNKIIDEYNLPNDLRQEYFEARNNPSIIHYVGKSMPIYQPYGDMYSYYWEYARLTPYYELLLCRMSEISNASKQKKYSQEIVTQFKSELTLKKLVKSYFLMPFVNFFFPKDSKRRRKLKAKYFRLRKF